MTNDRRLVGRKLGVVAGAILGLALATGGVAPSAARADAPAEADRFFQVGRKAATAGDYEAACNAFAESLKLERATGTLLNLGDCEEQRGHPAASLRYFKASLEKLPPNDNRAPIVQERVRSLEERVGRLVLRPRGELPPEALVTVDGATIERAEFGKEIRLDPGKHEVVVALVDHRDDRRDVAVAAGVVTEAELAPGALASDPPPPAAPVATVASSGLPLRTVGFVVGGLGVASLWVGSVAGLVAIDREHTESLNCHGKVCNQTGYDAATGGKTFATVSTITLIAGAAATGVGLYFVLRRPAASRTTSGAVAGGTTTTTIAPRFGAGGAGLHLLQTF